MVIYDVSPQLLRVPWIPLNSSGKMFEEEAFGLNAPRLFFLLLLP